MQNKTEKYQLHCPDCYCTAGCEVGTKGSAACGAPAAGRAAERREGVLFCDGWGGEVARAA